MCVPLLLLSTIGIYQESRHDSFRQDWRFAPHGVRGPQHAAMPLTDGGSGVAVAA